MKKQLLFGFAAMFAIGANAQNNRTIANPKAIKAKERVLNYSAEVPASAYSASGVVGNRRPMAAPYKRIGGSANVLGVQVPFSRALQYNKDINTVGMVFRKEAGWSGVTNGNSGTICYAYSVNNGGSWDSTVVAASTAYLHRYPSGSMFNVAGNTNPANAYAMVSGPWHPGQNWQGVYFGAKQLSFPGNNNNGNVVYSDNNALQPTQRKQDFARIDYQVTTDGKAHVMGELVVDANGTTVAAQAWRGASLNTGVSAGGGAFTWTVDSLKPNFKSNSTGTVTSGSTEETMTWSEDGQIGYVTFYGVDANAMAGTSMNSYQPYTYKTTNGGASWSRFAPLFDFSTIPAVSDRLFPVRGTATAFVKPFIYPNEGSAATVDANGNMHLICNMDAGISDHIDSLGYTYSPNYNQVWSYIVDFHTSSTGWCATVIDSLNCAGPTSNASDPSGTGNSNWTSSSTPFAYDARLQISRTTDGKFLFYAWADSDTTITGTHISTLPNIKMKGYDVVNDKYTDTKNMTAGKAGIELNAYWFYASTKAIQPTATTFIIPTSVTQSDDGSNNGDIAVSHYYIDDNMFATSEFTMTATGTCPAVVTGIKNNNNNTVAGLGFYPNPASNNGTIEVVLNDNSKMDVVIMNSVGQTVNTISVSGNAGVNKVDVNLSNLSAGLYFYQVKIGNSKSVTQKFVVEK